MRPIIILVFLVVSISVWGQKKTEISDEFTVTGKISKELKFSVEDILNLESVKIPDVVITNHMGEPRATAGDLSGVLVKELLKDMNLAEDSPKLFSEFYLTFVAIDNYKVVYSWNEIFNSPIGDQLFVITTRDGKTMHEMNDRILVFTPADYKTGRRHIKGLCQIIVNRV